MEDERKLKSDLCRPSGDGKILLTFVVPGPQDFSVLLVLLKTVTENTLGQPELHSAIPSEVIRPQRSLWPKLS